MSGYQFDIEYVNTKNNVADYFSRSPINNPDKDKTPLKSGDEICVNYIKNITDLEISFDEIKEHTLKDEILVEVGKLIRNGWPKSVGNESLKPYFLRKGELSIESDCVFWGCRLVIPMSLRKAVLTEIHKTHMGIVKSKSLARSYFWWPLMDRDLEDIVKSCENCLAYRNNPEKCSLISWDWPHGPWQRLHLDFMGPIFNRKFLVIVDAHSKWLECLDMGNNISSRNTIEKLRQIFSRFGLPTTVVTDNGTSFVSAEFKEFLNKNKIFHITCPVGHPASNGQAENGVKICKLALKRALHSKGCTTEWNQRLESFLLDYRNSIHSTTGISPAMILFNRNLRSRFDVINPIINKKMKDKELQGYQIKKKVELMQNKQKENCKGSSKKLFNLGNFVMAKDYSIPGKISWSKGKIKTILGKQYYLVQMIDKPNTIWKRHSNQLIHGKETMENYIPTTIIDPLEKINVFRNLNENNIINQQNSVKKTKSKIDWKSLQDKNRYPTRNK